MSWNNSFKSSNCVLLGVRLDHCFGLLDNVYLSRGRISVHLSFLQSMKNLPLLDDVLEVTLHIIQLITKGLTAHLLSHIAQILLVKFVGNVAMNLNRRSNLDASDQDTGTKPVDGITDDLPINPGPLSITESVVKPADSINDAKKLRMRHSRSRVGSRGGCSCSSNCKEYCVAKAYHLLTVLFCCSWRPQYLFLSLSILKNKVGQIL
jgi:hypothetical protein